MVTILLGPHCVESLWFKKLMIKNLKNYFQMYEWLFVLYV